MIHLTPTDQHPGRDPPLTEEPGPVDQGSGQLVEAGNVMPVVICQTGDIIGVCWPNTEWDTTEGTVRPRSLVSTLTISLSHSSNQRLLLEIWHFDNTRLYPCEGPSLHSPPIKYLIATIGPRICLFCAAKIFRYLDILHLESIDILMKELYWQASPVLVMACPPFSPARVRDTMTGIQKVKCLTADNRT